MGKFVIDAAMDAALDYIAACTLLSVTNDAGTPTDLTGALASVAVEAGDFEKADHTTGRKVTCAAQEDVVITASGTAKHVCLSLSGTIRLATTCTEQALVDNDLNTVDFPAFYYAIADPT